MKQVYIFTKKHEILSKEVADDYILQDGELWAQPEITHTPSPTEQLSMQQSQLALQQAQFQVSQQKLNSQLALQLAQLTAKEGQNV